MFLNVTINKYTDADLENEKNLNANFPSVIKNGSKYRLLKRYQNDRTIVVSGYSSGVLDSDINVFIHDFEVAKNDGSLKIKENIIGVLQSLVDIFVLITKTGTQYKKISKLFNILSTILNELEDLDAIEGDDILNMIIKKLYKVEFLDQKTNDEFITIISKFDHTLTKSYDKRRVDFAPELSNSLSQDLQISESMDFLLSNKE